jgi:hypothetical protein
MRRGLKFHIVRILILGLALTSISGAAAKTTATTFGPEWEFSNDLLYFSVKNIDPRGAASYESSDLVRGAQARMIAQVKKTCARSKACRVNDKYLHPDYGKVTYKDGWWFKISTDPGTVEVQAKPTTAKEFTRLKSRIDNDIFGSATHPDVGLSPNHETYGAGHIHIGVESSGMGKDPILFRNFIVDFLNHDEIAAGILNDGAANALPASRLSTASKQLLRNAVEQFDQSGRTKKDLALLIENINKSYAEEDEDNDKYQALNLLHEDTVEIRSLRMQRNMTDFLLEVRLFNGRIEELKKLKKALIPLGDLEETKSTVEQARRFREYVTNSGGDWEKYRKLLPKKYTFALRQIDSELCVSSQLRAQSRSNR